MANYTDFDFLFEKWKDGYYERIKTQYQFDLERARDKELVKKLTLLQLFIPIFSAVNNPYTLELLLFFDLNYRLGNSFNNISNEVSALRAKHIVMIHYPDLGEEPKESLASLGEQPEIIQLIEEKYNIAFSDLANYDNSIDPALLSDGEELIKYLARYFAISQFAKELLTNKTFEIKTDLSLISKSTSDVSANQKEFTTKRKALAIHYLNRCFKINMMQDTTRLAEFAAFITGNSYDNIYKALSGYSSVQTDKGEKTIRKERIKNLEFVRPYFEDLGLTEILKLIDNDLNSLR